MLVGKLLDDVRERYLTEFRDCIAYVKQNGMKAMCEAACRNKDGALVTDGALGLPMRLDIVGFAEGEAKNSIRVDSDSMLSFEPVEFDWGGELPTRLAPFTWDACSVRALGIPQNTDWAQLLGWFDRWFDGEDTRPADELGLCGVIHFLSDPKRQGNATIIQVDFGSAPEEALEELLDVLRDSGATKIEIGHDLAV